MFRNAQHHNQNSYYVLEGNACNITLRMLKLHPVEYEMQGGGYPCTHIYIYIERERERLHGGNMGII